MNKTLIFEGAGMSGTQPQVGNCRIRTRLQNNNGRIIYLEMGGTEITKQSGSLQGQYINMGYVDFVFYEDIEEDRKNNHSKELRKFEHNRFEYTKENILKFVNENLNCSYEDIKILNDERRKQTKRKGVSRVEL
jgi:hypothetical protein